MPEEVFPKLKTVVTSYESRHWWSWRLWSKDTSSNVSNALIFLQGAGIYVYFGEGTHQPVLMFQTYQTLEQTLLVWETR